MAKRITDEEIKLSIIINGNQAQKEILDLEKDTIKLKQANKELGKELKILERQKKQDSEEYKKLSAAMRANAAQIDKNEAKLQELIGALKITDLTMGQLQSRANFLRATLRHLAPGTADFKKFDAELKEVEARLTQLRGKAQLAKFSLSSLADGFNKYAAMVASFIAGITGIVLSIQQMIDYNGKLADAQSNVQKTTGLTKKEVDELTKSFGLLKTRTARTELLGLAEEAGRLGIKGVKDVAAFVAQANKIKVALGDDLGEESIREIGKMVNIYRVGEATGKDFAGAMDALGSAINEVSASGSNQAGFLVDYLKRQAGIASQARLSAADNVAYAATFDELGQSVEVSATAMNKVWADMFLNPADYAQIAKMSVKEFTQLLNTDANAAMIKFLEGLNGNTEGLDVMLKKMEDLEVGGSRGVQALAALASSTDLLKTRQLQSNKALQEATSLTNEYNLKNENLAGTLDKIKKKFLGAFSSEGISSALEGLAIWFGKLIGAVEDANKAFKEETKATYENATAARKAATESQNLLNEYYDLTKDGVKPTTEAKHRLDEITLLLSDHLGKGVMMINKETGALELNTEAVKEQIRLKRLLADDEAAALVSRLLSTEEEKKRLQAELPGLENIYNARKSLSDQAREEFNQTTKLQGRAKLGAESRLDAVLKERDAWLALSNVKGLIAEQDIRHADILEKLKELGYSDTDINALANSFKPKQSEGPKEGDTQVLNGVTFVFRNGRWVPLTSTVATTGTGKDNRYKDDLQKQLNEAYEAYKKAEEDKLALIEDSFKREVALETLNHQTRLHDIETRVKQLQDKEAELNKDLADPKKKLTGEEKASIAKTKEAIADELKQLNTQIEQEESLHQMRLGTIYENGISDAFTKMQQVFDKEKVLRETNYNLQYAALEGNKKAQAALTKKYQEEELLAQEAFLKDLLAKYNVVVSDSGIGGLDLSILSPDAIEKFKKDGIDIQLLLSELIKKKNELQGKVTGEMADSLKGDIDVLGFSAKQWEDTFNNLDTVVGKIKMAEMAVSSIKELYSMFSDYQSAKMEEELERYEANQQAQKAVLDKRLSSGYINQRQYNDAVSKMDDDAAKKKAELQLKQAKTEKMVNIASIIANTAIAVTKAVAASPLTFGMPWAGIVAAIGAAQLALAVATPITAKGYEAGLYNNDVVKREQDGKLFNAAYGGNTKSGLVSKPTYFLAGENNRPEIVIDNNAYRRMNPAVRDALIKELRGIKGFEGGLYNKDTNRIEVPAAGGSTTQDEVLKMVAAALAENTAVMRDLRTNGLTAVVSKKDTRSMKNLSDGLKEYNNLVNKNNV